MTAARRPGSLERTVRSRRLGGSWDVLQKPLEVPRRACRRTRGKLGTARGSKLLLHTEGACKGVIFDFSSAPHTGEIKMQILSVVASTHRSLADLASQAPNWMSELRSHADLSWGGPPSHWPRYEFVATDRGIRSTTVKLSIENLSKLADALRDGLSFTVYNLHLEHTQRQYRV